MRSLLLALACVAGAAAAQQDPWTDAFTIERVEIPPGIDPQIGGVDTTPSGKLAVCFHRGEVFFYDPAGGTWALFAEGLHEPLGLLAEGDASVLVMQRSELTRLRDTDGDGLADDYETVFDGFGMSGNYHEFGFGPAQDADGNLYVSLGTASNGAGVRREIRGPWSELGVPREKMTQGSKEWGKVRGAAGRMYSRVPWRGWVIQLSADGEQVTPWACGFRTPDGIGFDAEGRLLVTDNQGDWLGTSKVHHVRRDHFHGHPASLVWREGWDRPALEVPVAELEEMRTPAMALLPQGELANSPTQPIAIPPGAFGPLAGQTLIGEMNQKSLVRLLPDPVGDVSQGAAVPFLRSEALGNGNHRMTFTDDGSLWIAKTHLSWAGAEGLLRVRWKGAEQGLFAVEGARVEAGGFTLRFTEPVDPKSFGGVSVRSHTYNYHKAYGSPKVDERVHSGPPDKDAPERRPAAPVFEDGGAVVRLAVEGLEEGRVYTFDLAGVRARSGRPLLGTKVYYTLLKAR